MIIYSVIMFAVAVLFLIIAVQIYKGKTGLIHDYHQTKVRESDKKAYGVAFSKAMFVLAAALAVSGAISLLGETMPIPTIAVAVLFVGIAVSVVMIIKVQKKYNGGLF